MIKRQNLVNETVGYVLGGRHWTPGWVKGILWRGGSYQVHNGFEAFTAFYPVGNGDYSRVWSWPLTWL